MAREQEKELEEQTETKRQQHAERMARETAKNEGELAASRDKHNERLQDLRHRFNQAEGDLRRTAEKNVRVTSERLDDQFNDLTHNGEKRNRELASRLNNQEDYERLASRNRLESLRRDNHQQLESTVKLHQDKMKDIYKANDKKFNELRTNHEQATEKATDHFEQRLKTTLDVNEQLLRRIDSDAADKLESLRSSNTERLDAYRDTRRDPFYRSIELRASLSEAKDGYVLTARIPKHEQKNISINVRGNQIVLTGKRQSTERIDGKPGETLETSNYQSFSKTFPITWPVEPTYLTKEFVGDTLIVSIPKKEFWEANPILRERKIKPDQAKANRPNFPSDLPVDGAYKSEKKTPNLG
jgi:HSP20 family molecular chaperone IbpA